MKRNLFFTVGTCLVISCFILLSGCGQVQESKDDPVTIPHSVDWKSHVAFVEVYTSTGCTPCQTVVPTLELLASEYNANTLEVVFVEFHVSMFSDIYSTFEPKGEARLQDYYGGAAIPVTYFDGVRHVLGLYPDPYNKFKGEINTRLNLQQVLSIEAQAGLNGSKVTVVGSISNESASSYSNLTLGLVIMKDYGQTKYHYVAIDLVTKEVSSIPAGNNITFIVTSEDLYFTSGISAAVFIQKSDKEILESFLKTL